ncbi:hypothetical protein C2U72_10495 [Prosthecomicrobium hirschii]|uniref:hypothetical protein n=1 Tax=Prosthecodimorpha hirschii TaxID=665126 RepID=UPI001129424D|nr:hypothetical protein [Prosthecomicrobium hirschii]TPQ51014.1 hypothetical protein C2U72_10495 [Prosthecomicrobium hirschii]
MPAPLKEGDQQARHEIIFGFLGIAVVAAVVAFQIDVSFLPGGNLGLALLLLALLRLVLHAFWNRPRR